VSPFYLDKYEVTVARFRRFVLAFDGTPPSSGAGAHPRIAGSGWQAEWDPLLPRDRAGLEQQLTSGTGTRTWTHSAGGNELLPANYIDWYVAFAFCVWDGGRLPTEAEWEFAAAGGDENRPYPWGDAEVNRSLAVYGCTGDGSANGQCNSTDILPVGSRHGGNGRWGQADLAGSVFEWTLDYYDPSGYRAYADAGCFDCANLVVSPNEPRRVSRGGSWSSASHCLLATYRYGDPPSNRWSDSGIRCARDAT